MRRVHLLAQAVEEAIAAATWYEHQRTGLGADFAQTLDAAIMLLEADLVPLAPMPGQAGKRGAKRLALKRFPYDLVVREGRKEILVIAVAHQSRRPGYWRNRRDA